MPEREMTVIVYQITAPYFTAGLVLIQGIVTDAAPIIRYMLGWQEARMKRYVAHKSWEIEETTPKRKAAVKK